MICPECGSPMAAQRMPRNLCCAIWPVPPKEGGQLYAPP